jgi:DNA-directed RNA polymerase subunit L
MEPLLDILQKDQRLSFAGYKIKHVLENEIIVRLKCKPEVVGVSEKDCFQDALRSLLNQLCRLEDLYTATVLAP